MISITESLFKKPKYNELGLKEYLSLPNVKRFLELSKKLIIDKKSLSASEQTELKNLMEHQHVQKYIKAAKHNGMFNFSQYVGIKLVTFLAILGIAGPTHAIITPAIIIGTLVGLTSALTLGYFKTKDQREKVKNELQQINTSLGVSK